MAVTVIGILRGDPVLPAPVPNLLGCCKSSLPTSFFVPWRDMRKEKRILPRVVVVAKERRTHILPCRHMTGTTGRMSHNKAPYLSIASWLEIPLSKDVLRCVPEFQPQPEPFDSYYRTTPSTI